MNNLNTSALIDPHRLVYPGPWVGHIPFAAWLVSIHKPGLLVELGAHTGNSYCAFCQAITQNQLPTKAYAIDTWLGDEHAFYYGEEIFFELKSHHDPLYGSFSSLLRMTFDDALKRFEDGSIDLLHIDGLHTYEAVKHDFETWLPKLSRRGVVLFHDINEFGRDFGVHQLWDEVSKQYPGFSFKHSHGLGVLLVGVERNEELLALCESEHSGERWFYHHTLFQTLGANIERKLASIDYEEQILSLHRKVGERDKSIGERDGRIRALINERTLMINSNNMRITAPIRQGRRCLAGASQWVWSKLPLSAQRKQVLKNILFKHLPFALRWSNAYKNWAGLNAQIYTSAAVPASMPAFVPDLHLDVHVPKLKGQPLDTLPVRLIAFYLPQFHSIPENNQWWGEGFTEWTNVKPARPQFEGHYQPHIPGELGYYDVIEDKGTQRRQVELAKLYGIGGFCFYFYWFDGKTLLETPIENYLSAPSLDLPFCLCWANENWSRRWDGLDQDILIAQCHSPEDDLAFIAHVARYMRDERYIRINGKPLLLIYRPNLLPNVSETVERWRDWCHRNGLGEIYLACTQSFEATDPREYGLDAAVEFPPNNSAPPDITDKVQPLHDDFAGHVYDWRVFIERSRRYKTPDYRLFRSVCPAWDNTARKKNRGIAFANSSPCGYQEWLTNGIEETCARFADTEERVMFVNAWNEWAEGSHLEPDQRYGYAYLEATRMAMLRANLKLTRQAPEGPVTLAVIVHAFYPDILVEILDRLQQTGQATRLFVTTIAEHTHEVDALLYQSGIEYCLRTVENRGRDILPFLTMLNEVEKQGYRCLLKLHTKKSRHRKDGDFWRNDLFDKLLGRDNMAASLELLRDRNIGVISPDDHLVPMHTYWGTNAERVEKISARLGVEKERCAALSFVAGSMFYAKLEALKPLMNLSIDVEDFEMEAGQVDATMAHTIERIIAVSAEAAGYQVVTQGGTSQPNAQYAFAQRSH